MERPPPRAGILSGDLITHINDEAVQGLSLEEAVGKMKGPIDTKTQLKIIRKGVDLAYRPFGRARKSFALRPVSYHRRRGRYRLYQDHRIQRNRPPTD